MESVGAYDAKTHLPRLLDEVAAGKTIMITKHGTPVARLTPAQGEVPRSEDVISALRHARRGVTLGDTTIRELIQEGRR
ncbi:type II toxin-antitoxin system Phd/YefM family antitoxin [Planomonospora venezuelensis]|uniref:Antitoxin n=1 Tax=Planomonospora venezuelensis TaxID=1999 RepID=A0A841D397_PLAVE|nr:type II toxin-antitoxin system prevent-host-death family antitoxin [Planomonospora venezuelensis]MBB5963959.1 prevent-host-death family protein [Planomonospora venezuelensis]GIN03908.1 antitoxin [Planomonospora venezuelensis]